MTDNVNEIGTVTLSRGVIGFALMFTCLAFPPRSGWVNSISGSSRYSEYTDTISVSWVPGMSPANPNSMMLHMETITLVIIDYKKC